MAITYSTLVSQPHGYTSPPFLKFKFIVNLFEKLIKYDVFISRKIVKVYFQVAFNQ